MLRLSCPNSTHPSTYGTLLNTPNVRTAKSHHYDFSFRVKYLLLNWLILLPCLLLWAVLLLLRWLLLLVLLVPSTPVVKGWRVAFTFAGRCLSTNSRFSGSCWCACDSNIGNCSGRSLHHVGCRSAC